MELPRVPRPADRWMAPTLTVLVVAVVLQLLHFLQVTRGGPALSAPMGDSVVYLKLAQQLRDGRDAAHSAFYWSPLYTLLLAALGKGLVTGLQLVAGIATRVLAGAMASRLAGSRAGFFATAVAALYWTPMVYHGRLVPVTLATALGAAATLLLLHGGRWWRWALAGLCFGAAGVLMPQSLLAPVVAGLFLMVRRRPRWREALLLGAGVLVAVAPVTVRNSVAGRDFMPVSSSGGFNFYVGNNPNAVGGISRPPEMQWFRPGGRELVTVPEQEEFQRVFAESTLHRPLKPSRVSAFWLGRGIGWLFRNPLAAVELWGRKLLLGLTGYELADSYYPEVERRRLWTLKLLPVSFALLLGLAAVGVVLRRRQMLDVRCQTSDVGCAERTASGELWPVLVVPVAVLAALLLFFVNARFRLPAAPMLAVLAGLALDRTLLPATTGRRAGVAAAFLAVTLGSGVLLPAAFGEAVRYDEVYGLLNSSTTLQATGDLPEAAALLDRAAELVGGRQSDDLARGYVGLGNRWFDRRDIEGAAKAYGKATMHDTTYAPGFLMRGVVDLAAGNVERALGYAGEAIRRDPQMANAWVLQARALLLLGEAAAARRSAERARSLEPASPLVQELMQLLEAGR